MDQKVKGALERHIETVDSTKAQRFPFEFFSVASSSLVIKIWQPLNPFSALTSFKILNVSNFFFFFCFCFFLFFCFFSIIYMENASKQKQNRLTVNPFVSVGWGGRNGHLISEWSCCLPQSHWPSLQWCSPFYHSRTKLFSLPPHLPLALLSVSAEPKMNSKKR